MEWLYYLLKVTACMTLFYALYYFYFQKLTFFSLNRFYLLGTLVFSFVIPGISLPIKSDRIQHTIPEGHQQEVSVSGLRSTLQLPNSTLNQSPVTGNAHIVDWQQLLTDFYWIIAGAILFTATIQLFRLIWQTRKVIGIEGRLKIIQSTGSYANCSFLNYVFINDKELDKDTLAAVIQHEGVHASQFHSFDKLLLSVCKALLWFSPPVYLYSRALEQAHEYEADRKTSMRIGDTSYANLLLNLAISLRPAPLVHSFVRNPIKARITMLFTNPSKNMKKLTYLILLPAGMALLWSFSVKVVYAQSTPVITQKATNFRGNPTQPASSISAALPGKSLPVRPKQNLSSASLTAETPVRLVDHAMLGDDPLVIIDGKKYTAEILTRISPSCIKQSRLSFDKAVIETRNKKVEYATKAEIATARIRIQMKNNGKFYNRYPVTITGLKKDEVMIKSDAAAMEAPFPVGYRVMLLIGGKAYTESEAKALPLSTSLNITALKYRYADDDSEVKSLYGDKCDVLIEVQKRPVSGQNDVEVTLNASSTMTEDALGKLYFSAKDSVITNDFAGVLTLYGAAKLENAKFDLSADKMVFDKSSRTVVAENVEFKVKGVLKNAALAKFDLYKGTYEILTPAAVSEQQ